MGREEALSVQSLGGVQVDALVFRLQLLIVGLFICGKCGAMWCNTSNLPEVLPIKF